MSKETIAGHEVKRWRIGDWCEGYIILPLRGGAV